MNYLLVFVAAILTDNLVFTRLLGMEHAMAAADDPSSALRGGGLVTAVTAIVGTLTYVLYLFVLRPLSVGFLAIPLCVLLTCAALAALKAATTENGTRRNFLHEQIPLCTVNSVILGAVYLAAAQNMNLWRAILLFVCAGVGYTLAALVFASVHARLTESDPPAAFAGVPLMLVAAALAVMAFSGFAGLRF